jgi:hypothetical protein
MKPSIPSLVPFFVALVALQGASTLWMTATHNAQLKAQAEVFNAQLKAQTEVHNAQLLALTERLNAQLLSQAAEFQKK